MKDDKISSMVAVAPLKPRGRGRPKIELLVDAERRVTNIPRENCARMAHFCNQNGVSEAAFIRDAVEEKLDREGVPRTVRPH